jgi:hypothetical protein
MMRRGEWDRELVCTTWKAFLPASFPGWLLGLGCVSALCHWGLADRVGYLCFKYRENPEWMGRFFFYLSRPIARLQ